MMFIVEFFILKPLIYFLICQRAFAVHTRYKRNWLPEYDILVHALLLFRTKYSGDTGANDLTESRTKRRNIS